MLSIEFVEFRLFEGQYSDERAALRAHGPLAEVCF